MSARLEYMTTKAIARGFGVSGRAVRYWVTRHGLPALKTGGPRGPYRVSRADLEAFLERWRARG